MVLYTPVLQSVLTYPVNKLQLDVVSHPNPSICRGISEGSSILIQYFDLMILPQPRMVMSSAQCPYIRGLDASTCWGPAKSW
jgi:hypothetical protein